MDFVTIESVVGAMGLGLAYCLGGLHGLWLAWTQPARMRHWAARAEALSDKLNEIEERGKNR